MLGYYELTLFISGKCNYNCNFCGFKDTRLFPDMSMETVKKLAAVFENLISTDLSQKYRINFIGGEPTLYIDKLIDIYNILDPLRQKYKDNLDFMLTTNGYFGSTETILSKFKSMHFDLITLSVSIDHYNQGNAEYIKNILLDGTDFNIKFCTFNENVMIPKYVDSIVKDLNDEQTKIIKDYFENKDNMFPSSVCCTITEDKEVIEFLSNSDIDAKVVYVPFGIFIVENGIYTSCAGEGTLPWCKLSDNVLDIKSSLDKIKGMSLIAHQKCTRNECLSCRHLQKRGYSCFNPKEVKVTHNNKNIIIEEI